ncbi:hypothetical protein Rwratislav_30914 [Rhodococcus wratislaviensis IFP 2016]|nr:hypothetical protein Rwratislav_30914 [Rhodococcus wratislaviensis IFP 2016]
MRPAVGVSRWAPCERLGAQHRLVEGRQDVRPRPAAQQHQGGVENVLTRGALVHMASGRSEIGGSDLAAEQFHQRDHGITPRCGRLAEGAHIHGSLGDDAREHRRNGVGGRGGDDVAFRFRPGQCGLDLDHRGDPRPVREQCRQLAGTERRIEQGTPGRLRRVHARHLSGL